MTDPFTPPGDATSYGATPGPPLYGAPEYGAPLGSPNGPPGARRNGFGTTALVLGILAVPGAFLVVPGLVLGILAIVFGVLGRRRARRHEATNGGAALGGLITGVVATVIAVAVIVVVVLVLNSKAGKDYQSCRDAALTQRQVDACTTQFRHDLGG